MNPDRELNAYLAGGEHARRDVLDRLRELHQPVKKPIWTKPNDKTETVKTAVTVCQGCCDNFMWRQYPCETRRIIDEYGDDQ